AQRRWPSVLLNDPHLPVAVLKILPEQRRQACTWMVPASNARRVPDLPARPGQPQIEFVVLISHQRFVEKTDTLEHASLIETTEHGVRPAFVAHVVPTRAAD